MEGKIEVTFQADRRRVVRLVRLPPGQSTTLNLAGNNSVTLSIIPEPSTFVIGGLGVLGLFKRRRQV